MMQRRSAALIMVLALGACGNSFDMGPREITFEYPPGDAAAAETAEQQCKPFGKSATFKGTETRGNVTSTIYACS